MSGTEGTKLHRDRQQRASRNKNTPEPSVRRPARTGPHPSQTVSEELPVQAAPVRKRVDPRIILALLLVLQIVFLGLLIAKIVQNRQSIEPVSLELRYLVPGQEDIVENVTFGDPVVLRPPVQLENYTFLGWENADGELETRSSFPIYEDTVYIARYAMTFETEKHIPYLSLDEDNVLDVDAAVTNRELVSILYKLLDIRLVGKGEFLDVSKDDSCYKAAATLKDLGIISGARLHPDEAATRVGLLEMLCSFVPASAQEYRFRDLDRESPFYSIFCTAAANGWIQSGPETDAAPTDIITRGRLAQILNRVLGRDTLRRPDDALVGMILDVSPESPYYNDVIEAVIPHEYVMDGAEEVWTSAETLPVHAPGLFFTGVRLRYIFPDGTSARNTTVKGMTFNANGELTTGDAELDRALWDYLSDIIDPETMDEAEMLHTIYTRVWKDYSYHDGYVYDILAGGWVIPEAKSMLEAGEGNSYSFSALFSELAVLIGCKDVRAVSGLIYGTQTEFESRDGHRVDAPSKYTPYAWVEIRTNGVIHVYDPTADAQSGGLRNMYRRNGQVILQYGYRTY